MTRHVSVRGLSGEDESHLAWNIVCDFRGGANNVRDCQAWLARCDVLSKRPS